MLSCALVSLAHVHQNPYIPIRTHMSMACESYFSRRYQMENSFYDSFGNCKRIIIIVPIVSTLLRSSGKAAMAANSSSSSGSSSHCDSKSISKQRIANVDVPVCISSVHMIYSGFCRQKRSIFKSRTTQL